VLKWEYYIFNIVEDDLPAIVKALNTIGQEGWEIVTYEYGTVEQEGKSCLTAKGLVKRQIS
jgi:hypothetical protein